MFQFKNENKIDYNDDLFHFLTGKYSIKEENNYDFYIEDKKNFWRFKSKPVSIADPAYDSNFKAIFYKNPARLKDFLNNIFFISNNMELEKIYYLSNEYYDIGNKYNLNSLKSDIVCKGLLKNRKKF